MRTLIKVTFLLIIVFLIVELGSKFIPASQQSMLSYFTPAAITALLRGEKIQLPFVTPGPTNAPTVLVTDHEKVVTGVVEKSIPSVVTIGIKTVKQQPRTMTINPFDPFGFNDIQPQQPQQPQKIEQNIGSGFVVTQDGLIITNRHVVSEENAAYTVRLNDGKTHDVTQMYRDPLNDLAILKIEATGLPALTMGNSDSLKLGQLAIAIGTPLGEFTNTVTTGIVSGLGRGITAGSPYEGLVEKLDGVIQTDAAISPGNSGGPLLDSSGHVIGVNTAVSGSGQNIGFAIPANIVQALLKQFEKRGGNFERPYLGVRYRALDRETAIANKLVEGAYITEIVLESPAAKAGLQLEDVITAIDGQKISGTDEESILKIILDKKVGDTVRVTYWRDGQEKTVNVVLVGHK